MAPPSLTMASYPISMARPYEAGLTSSAAPIVTAVGTTTAPGVVPLGDGYRRAGQSRYRDAAGNVPQDPRVP